jgi:hypothetical protein
MDFGDSKNTTHLQQIRIQAQNTHKENHTNHVRHNLQKHVLESQITKSDLSSHDLGLSLTH